MLIKDVAPAPRPTERSSARLLPRVSDKANWIQKQRALSSSRQLQLTQTKRDPKRGWCSVLAVRPRLRGELTNVVLAIDTGWQVKEGEQVAVLVHAVEQVTMRNVIDSVLVSAHEEIPHCILAGRF